MRFLYRMLPSGNVDDFPKINRELRRLKVKAQYARTRAGGRIYRITEAQVKRLPKLGIAPCLPTGRADSGYILWKVFDDENTFAVTAWRAV